MLRWLFLALLGLLVSLYSNDVLQIHLSMPASQQPKFDYTKVDTETVLMPTFSMLGGRSPPLASYLVDTHAGADEGLWIDSITQQSWGLGGTGAALANLYQRKL